ncbi:MULTISPECIES: uroporphyrinogen decarboxylase family protein [Aerococcus]|uniref:Uroporphyrinogen decarboxylase n=2 Tax=Aerococcus TaxID=1375 RepID=A0A178HDL6_9LACT|nr:MULTISPECIES: uroporphyrinogen decarboxylase family protein [Aerococcus]KAA9219095.1 uroporphyrinogen decarboxylase [Aerococcus loyolae]KAA9263963.1 uroporphyrinogen decarboxylase [Aerococcus loyolae]MCY3026148.1 uroporphyrinogen decarboxylase [Aerococcus loyolae]MCY3027620.1 uroporphyrinogen decarboxylase [Aerococcus loyolae]MCY3029491.1 uroporphyrinogen decarboxylase [Aerococcus loyolae]
MSKKELVKTVFDGHQAERTPVGFWHHFVEDVYHANALKDDQIKPANLAGHQQFLKDIEPDYIKIMTDGYFQYPNEKLQKADHLSEVGEIEPLANDDPWIQEQIQFAKEVEALHNNQLYSFYNIFGPLTTFKILYDDQDERVSRFYQEDPELFAKILKVIAGDIQKVIEGILSETTVDGIYYSTQDLQTSDFTDQDFIELVKPLDTALLNRAKELKPHHILHVCGYLGAHNRLEKFADYPASAVNWATGPEKLSIEDGKKIFKDKVVVGGFQNTADDLIYKGTESEIKAYTKELIKEAGDTPYVIGADCTIPADTPKEHFEWVRQASIEEAAENEK